MELRDSSIDEAYRIYRWDWNSRTLSFIAELNNLSIINLIKKVGFFRGILFWLSFKFSVSGYTIGLTLNPYIIIKGFSFRTLKHEIVHIYQQKKEGLFLFLIKYVFYFVKNLFQTFSLDLAYYYIPYEDEAYKLEKLEMNELKIYLEKEYKVEI